MVLIEALLMLLDQPMMLCFQINRDQLLVCCIAHVGSVGKKLCSSLSESESEARDTDPISVDNLEGTLPTTPAV